MKCIINASTKTQERAIHKVCTHNLPKKVAAFTPYYAHASVRTRG